MDIALVAGKSEVNIVHNENIVGQFYYKLTESVLESDMMFENSSDYDSERNQLAELRLNDKSFTEMENLVAKT